MFVVRFTGRCVAVAIEMRKRPFIVIFCMVTFWEITVENEIYFGLTFAL